MEATGLRLPEEALGFSVSTKWVKVHRSCVVVTPSLLSERGSPGLSTAPHPFPDLHYQQESLVCSAGESERRKAPRKTEEVIVEF
jgi:hypothetical protein